MEAAYRAAIVSTSQLPGRKHVDAGMMEALITKLETEPWWGKIGTSARGGCVSAHQLNIWTLGNSRARLTTTRLEKSSNREGTFRVLYPSLSQGFQGAYLNTRVQLIEVQLCLHSYDRMNCWFPSIGWYDEVPIWLAMRFDEGAMAQQWQEMPIG